MKAYWFEPKDGVLGYGDGRAPEAGVTHTVDCAPVLCRSGLHASVHPFDALQHANSSVLWIVELGGTVVEGADKCAATERTYTKRVDVEKTLRAFARKCALVSIEKAKPYFTDEGWACCIDYLNTGDEEKRSAAWLAADSARSAADSAWSAARSAVDSARSAVDSARSAVDSAAWSAARSAWSAARSAADSARSAVDSEARSEARSAAWSAQRELFAQMIDEVMGVQS